MSLDTLNYDVIYKILEYAPYQSILSLKMTSTRYRDFVKEYFNSVSLRLRHKINVSDISDEELIERVYFLNNYIHNSPTDILITNQIWQKGNNIVKYGSGTISNLSWISDDIYWRINGPASVEKYNGKVIKIAYSRTKGGPYTVTGYSPDGQLSYIRKGYNGKLHSINDEPALTMYSSIGPPAICYYFKHGVLHRDDGPAVDSCWFKKWYIDGHYREDSNGPSAEIYHDDGSKTEHWYIDGQLVLSFIDNHGRPIAKCYVTDELLDEIPDAFYTVIDPNN